MTTSEYRLLYVSFFFFFDLASFDPHEETFTRLHVSAYLVLLRLGPHGKAFTSNDNHCDFDLSLR